MKPDHPSEATAPLLRKDQGGDTEVFNLSNRRPQDRNWLYSYLVLLALALAGGIYGLVKRNPHFTELTTMEHLNDPASCPLETHARGLRQDSPTADNISIDAFLGHAVRWTAAALGGALLLGLAFLYLTRKSATALVATAVALQVGLPIIGGGMLFSQGSMGGGIAMLGVAGFLGLLFFLWREQISLVIRLLSVAGHALSENWGLVGVALALEITLGLAALPAVIFGFASFTNGHLIYNPARDQHPSTPSNAELGCTDLDGNEVLCCTWQPDGWVIPYWSVLTLAFLWTSFLLFEIKVFTVAGTVAQWYFTPVSLTSLGRLPPSRVKTSLKHALGPSLGSLCFSSAILTLCSLMRQMLEKARREADNNIFFSILAAILSLFYAIIEFATKFATVEMAISGKPFMNAAHTAVDILKRNFMDAFGVWWLPPLILQNCAFVAALAYGGGMWFAGYLDWGHDQSSGVASSWVLAGLSFVFAWIVLAFFTALLLNVVDAVFMCFALDRDLHTVSRLEVHQVLVLLPTVGPVVEQPGGEYAYGAPAAAGGRPSTAAV